MVEVKVEAMNAGFIFLNFETNASKSSDFLFFANAVAKSGVMAYFSASFSVLSEISSGFSILSNRSFVIFMGATSVSGYIRAAPGIGRRKVVEKSASAFLT